MKWYQTCQKVYCPLAHYILLWRSIMTWPPASRGVASIWNFWGSQSASCFLGHFLTISEVKSVSKRSRGPWEAQAWPDPPAAQPLVRRPCHPVMSGLFQQTFLESNKWRPLFYRSDKSPGIKLNDYCCCRNLLSASIFHWTWKKVGDRIPITDLLIFGTPVLSLYLSGNTAFEVFEWLWM